MKAIVIGAGIVGSSVSYQLARRGYDVTVIDDGRPATKATGASFAWLNSNAKEPRSYHTLNMLAIGEHGALSREIGSSDWLARVGNLEVAGTAEAVERINVKASALEGTGYPVRVISPKEISSIEPTVRIKDDYLLAAYFPGEGYADAVLLSMRLLDAAVALGATISDAGVSRLVQSGSTITGVQTKSGETLSADIVVMCAGSSSGELLEEIGVTFPTRGKAGVQITTAPGLSRLATVLHLPGLSVRPDAAGRIILRSKPVDDLIDLESWTVPAEAIQQLLDQGASALLGLVGELTAERVRLAYRPRPSDGLPAVGAFPGIDGLYLVSTHSGVTLGPILGRLAATEIATGDQAVVLEDFRPERLLQGAKA